MLIMWSPVEISRHYHTKIHMSDLSEDWFIIYQVVEHQRFFCGISNNTAFILIEKEIPCTTPMSKTI